jgi:pyridoxamine 5'-phosphate oxidase
MDERDPIARFRNAYERALERESFDPSRAAFATSDAQGRPSVRFVLVKQFDERGFVVYTNLESKKGLDLAEKPFASLSFHWASIGEQVRIDGEVERVVDAEADAYFQSRPRGSQIGAWASAQSREIASRTELEERVRELSARFGEGEIPRPEFWGGFRIVPRAIEFWLDRPDRLHDRFLYTRDGGAWSVARLSP